MFKKIHLPTELFKELLIFKLILNSKSSSKLKNAKKNNYRRTVSKIESI